MRCDLAGLLSNAARAIRLGDRSATVTAFGLEEAVKHVEMLRKGEATLEEFCDHYCLPFSEPPCPHPSDRAEEPDGCPCDERFRDGDDCWAYQHPDATPLELFETGPCPCSCHRDCPHPPDKRVTYGGGVAAPLGRETDTVWCDECGEQVSDV